MYRVTHLFKSTILPIFGHLIVKKITATYCQKVVNDWVNQYKGYRNHLAYVKKVLEYAVKMNIISVNPFQHIQVPKTQDDNTSILYYDKEELQNVLSTLKDYDTFL